MTLDETLFAITKSTHEEFGNGYPINPADAHAVQDFLVHTGPVDYALFFAVGRLTLRSFMQANADEQWSVKKDFLWQRFEVETGTQRSPPVWWTPNARLSDLTMYLNR